MALTSFSAAANAYASAARSITGAAGLGSSDAASDPASPPVNEAGQSFADLVQSGLKSAGDAVRKSEEMSKAGLTGKADVRDVVAAVTNAELTLQTVTAVRDKVVSAYNEILRMPI